MRVSRMMLLLAVACLIAPGTLQAANSLDVNGPAAIEGNYGLEILHDGSGNRVYVKDNSPADETVYRMSFWVDKTVISMDNCGGSCATRYVMFLARQEDPTAVTVFRVIFGRLAVDGAGSTPRYTVRLGTRQDNGNFRYIGGVVVGSVKQIMVEWAAGNGDGVARLYARNNTGLAFSLKGERTDLDNDTMNIDHIRLGACSALDDQGSDVLTSGSLYLDSFESYRTLSTP